MKRIFYLISIISVTVTLTACWDARPISELAYISGIGIDKEEDYYVITLEILNTAEFTGNRSGNSQISIETIKTESIPTLNAIILSMQPRLLFYGQTKTVLLSEEVAKEGIAPILDSFYRGKGTRFSTKMAIVKGMKAQEAMGLLLPFDFSMSIKLDKIIKSGNSRYGAPIYNNRLTIGNDLTLEGKDVHLPIVKISGNVEEGHSVDVLRNSEDKVDLKVDQIALFNEDKFVGELSVEDSLYAGYLFNDIQSTFYTIENEECNYNFTIGKVETKVNGELKNGQPVFDIKVKGISNINEISCPTTLNEGKFNQLEAQLNIELEEHLAESIKAMQENKSDIYGFGEIIHRKYKDEWLGMKDYWNEEFINAEFDIEFNIELKSAGNMKSTLGLD